VVDLAVGVIIGGAFGKIVTSLVDQIIMPPIGLATGGLDFAELKYVLKAADPATKHAEVAIGYGVFVNTVIQFLIVALVIFVMVRGINRLRREEAAAPSAPPAPTKTETRWRRSATRCGARSPSQPGCAPGRRRCSFRA